MSNDLDNSQDMMGRLFLAFLLSVGVMLLAPYFYQRGLPPQELAPLEIEEASEQPGLVEDAIAVPSAPLLSQLAPTTNISPQILRVENDDMVMTWSNDGAVISQVELRHFPSLAGGGVLLMPGNVIGSRPLELRTGVADIDRTLAGAVYEIVGGLEGQVNAPVDLVFRYAENDLVAERRVRVPAEGYAVEIASSVQFQGTRLPTRVVLGPGIGEKEGSGTDFDVPGAAIFSVEGVERYSATDLEEGGLSLPGGVRWAAVDSKYFSLVLLAPEAITGLQLSAVEYFPDQGAEEAERRVQAEVVLEPQAEPLVYFGPKDLEVLGAIDPSLSELIDFGWFGLIVKPLLLALKYIYSFVGNYGWAIIVLTLLINLALFPVKYKQVVSMKKMSALQPQMKAIQDKYKRLKRDDPRKSKMNEEVMGLYRENGVNPLGGCLPLLIQFPFLIGFYNMLYASIELRGAPFMLWIQDLSQPDPLYLTPIIMGLVMVVQQKMMPGTADPTQAKMMMFMPVVLTFFFLSVSSGLAIYFLFSNLFGIMFQLAIERLSPRAVEANAKSKHGKKRAKSTAKK